MLQPGQIVVYKGEYRMVYGIYKDGYVSLCLHDYLDVECDTMVQSKALELVDNNDYYVVETGTRILYITAGDADSALEVVDGILLDDEEVYSCQHGSTFISLK